MESVKYDNNDCIRLENQLCFPLYACAKEVVRQYRKPLEELNLTYTQYIVMMVLWEFGGDDGGRAGEKGPPGFRYARAAFEAAGKARD